MFGYTLTKPVDDDPAFDIETGKSLLKRLSNRELEEQEKKWCISSPPTHTFRHLTPQQSTNERIAAPPRNLFYINKTEKEWNVFFQDLLENPIVHGILAVTPQGDTSYSYGCMNETLWSRDNHHTVKSIFMHAVEACLSREHSSSLIPNPLSPNNDGKNEENQTERYMGILGWSDEVETKQKNPTGDSESKQKRGPSFRTHNKAVKPPPVIARLNISQINDNDEQNISTLSQSHEEATTHIKDNDEELYMSDSTSMTSSSSSSSSTDSSHLDHSDGSSAYRSEERARTGQAAGHNHTYPPDLDRTQTVSGITINHTPFVPFHCSLHSIYAVSKFRRHGLVVNFFPHGYILTMCQRPHRIEHLIALVEEFCDAIRE